MRDFIIPFIGLKIGKHAFEFDVSDAFFDHFKNSIIAQGKVHAKLMLEKKETMLIGNFSIEGEIATTCDRCNDPIRIPISGNFELIFKFSNEQSDNETLIHLSQDAYELDTASHFYELMIVSMPTRVVHEAGFCNEEVVSTFDQYIINQVDEDNEGDWDDDDENWDDEDDIDPRWSDLKKLN